PRRQRVRRDVARGRRGHCGGSDGRVGATARAARALRRPHADQPLLRGRRRPYRLHHVVGDGPVGALPLARARGGALMTSATALVLEGERRLVRHELPLPAIGDDDALLRVEACGLCGTDHELFTGAVAWPPGFVPGHETVGVVEEIGAGAAARWGVAAGDRVAVGNRRACRECAPCRAGDLARCVRFGAPASYGLTPVA